jgi:hypothetical protein
LLDSCFPLSNSTQICSDFNENDHKKNPIGHSYEYLPEAESFEHQSTLHGRPPDLRLKLQRPVRADGIVVAAKQRKMILKTFLPSRIAYRLPIKIRRALADCQIQLLDKGCIQF